MTFGLSACIQDPSERAGSTLPLPCSIPTLFVLVAGTSRPYIGQSPAGSRLQHAGGVISLIEPQ
jgi:hypothetical protein